MDDCNRWNTITTVCYTREFYYATLLSFKDAHSVTTFPVSNRSNKKVVYYYSPGRSDRSGAIIHDMLFAHAYTFHTNNNQSNIYAIYGGCCGRNIIFRNETYHLLFDLHWDTILKFDCPPPPSSRNRTTATATANATATDKVDDDSTYILLDPKVYRQSDVYGFTTEWRKYFMKQINIQAQQQPSKQISTTDATLVNTNNLPSNAKVPYSNNIEIVHDVVPMHYSIAVHIRRGDINPCNKYRGRYLPNSHYLQLIQQYISILLLSSSTTNTTQTPPTGLSRENIAVTIYSESISYEPLDIFEQYNYTVSVDDALSTVWSALSTAHVAILSISSFSYVPAIINPNRVVYTPFRHKPMSQWDVVSDTLISQSMSEVMKLRRRTCPESSTT